MQIRICSGACWGHGRSEHKNITIISWRQYLRMNPLAFKIEMVNRIQNWSRHFINSTVYDGFCAIASKNSSICRSKSGLYGGGSLCCAITNRTEILGIEYP